MGSYSGKQVPGTGKAAARPKFVVCLLLESSCLSKLSVLHGSQTTTNL